MMQETKSERQQYFAKLHAEALDLFEYATGVVPWDMALLQRAFNLERQVANATIELGLGSLAVYAYSTSAALMANMLRQKGEALNILNRARHYIDNEKLVQKIDSLIAVYSLTSRVVSNNVNLERTGIVILIDRLNLPIKALQIGTMKDNVLRLPGGSWNGTEEDSQSWSVHRKAVNSI